MTRDSLIENVILWYLLGAACYNICTLMFFFWKQWSEIKKTDNISEYHIALRAYHKKQMMTRAIMLIAVLYLLSGAIFAHFSLLNLGISFIASYFAIKGFSNIFGDFLTCDNIDKIQLCNLYLRSFNIDATSSGIKIERSISKHFSEYAQVFSIGNPASILPSLRTTSIYATDDKWKETVTTLMERAKMVIIRIGQTGGTLWELEQCIAHGYQHKSIFIVDGKHQFALLTQNINEIGLFISHPPSDEIAAVFFNHLSLKWEYLSLGNKSAVRDLYNRVIESLGYKEEIKEIRSKRLFFWKYLFVKNNFPKKLKPFSLGYLLNSVVYYFYNNWHQAIIIYYAISFVAAQFILRPYINDSIFISLPTFFIWLSLLLFQICTLVFAPQISWLSRRWPSYEYFNEDNSQLNRILLSFWGIVISYNICICLITYLLLGHPYYIGY